MKEWLASREPRERAALIAGGIVLILVLVYALVWQPLHRELERNRALVQEQRQTLAWMEQAAEEVAALRARGASSATEAPAAGQSLAGYVEQSARSANLGQHIARMEPGGRDGVQLTLKDAPFDSLITWLASLQGPGQPRATILSATRTEQPGLVNATLTLERAGSDAE